MGLMRKNEGIDKGLKHLGVKLYGDPKKTSTSIGSFNSFRSTSTSSSPAKYVSPFNDPIDYRMPNQPNKEIDPEVDDKFDKIERFIRQADRIISGDFKVKKDKSILENLFTICDTLKIGPEDIKEVIKSKKIEDDKNYLLHLYEELRGLYSDDWGDEV